MRSFAVLTIVAALFIASSAAQQSRVPAARVVATVDNNSRATLSGHLHPQARTENDLGRLSPSAPLTHVTLMLSQSPAQQVVLKQLLEDQQNPSSPLYHQWLTPEEYGVRFGVGDSDISKLTSWLQ